MKAKSKQNGITERKFLDVYCLLKELGLVRHLLPSRSDSSFMVPKANHENSAFFLTDTKTFKPRTATKSNLLSVGGDLMIQAVETDI